MSYDKRIKEALERDDITPTDIENELFSTQNIEMKSRIEKYKIPHIANILILSKKFGLTTLYDITMKELELYVSVDGKGREEYVRLKNWSYEGSDKE